MINGYIIYAKSKDKKVYVSNSSPILWIDNIEKSKKFDTYNSAKNELLDNFISLGATIKYTNISAIYIAEYRDNKEIGKEKFL